MLESEIIIILLGVITIINILFTGLIYRKIGSSLQITSPDPFTYLYYSQLFLIVLGSYFILINLDNTDWLTYLDKDNSVRLIGWMVVQYSFLVLGLTMLVVKPYMMPNSLRNKFFMNLSNKSLSHISNYRTIFFLTSISILAGLYTYLNVGYIALFKIFESSGTALALVRSETKIGFQGITFIRDNFFIGLTQIIALYIYSLCLSYKKMIIYKVILLILVFLVLISTTSNLEKGGFIFFLISMLSMYAYRGKKFSKLFFSFLIIIISILIILAYVFTFGDHVNTSYLIKEISGRIFIAQVAGVFMTLSIFPDYIPFIGFEGISLLAKILGIDQNEGSPRLVMSYFWPNEVELGLLGYMSSYFPAEAYGNFGVFGIIVAPIVVGLVTLFYVSIFMRFKNPHLGAALIVFIIFHLPFTSNFSYFYYSPGLILLIFFIYIIDKLNYSVKL